MGEFASYAQLQETVRDWLSRNDLDHRIPTFIYMAELDVQRMLKLNFHDTTAAGTFVAAQDYIELPDDYIEARFLRLETSPLSFCPVVSWDKLTEIKQADKSDGVPLACAQLGNLLYVAPTPSTSHGYTLFYKAGIAHLSDTNRTNWLLENAGDVLLYGSLIHASPYLHDDERALTWATLYDRAAQAVKKQDWRSRTGHGPLRMRPERFA